jgi:hypothetical protein
MSTKTRDNPNNEPMNLMNSRNEAHEPGERILTSSRRIEYKTPHVARVYGGQRSARPTTWEAGRDGQKVARKWANLGKSGQDVRKRTGLARLAPGSIRLGPDKPTQVVDFPRMYDASIFWGSVEIVATDETQIKHGFGKRHSTEGNGANGGKMSPRTTQNMRTLSKDIGNIRAVGLSCQDRNRAFAYVRLNSLKFAYVRLF